MQEDPKIEEYLAEIPLEERGGEGWKAKLTDLLQGKYFVPAIIVLVAIIAFALGRISGLQDKKMPVRVISNNSLLAPLLQQERETGQTAAVGASMVGNSEQVVASKNGTKYHYPWCAGAKQISDQNKVTFNSIEEAQAKGYTPATNCKGLK